MTFTLCSLGGERKRSKPTRSTHQFHGLAHYIPSTGLPSTIDTLVGSCCSIRCFHSPSLKTIVEEKEPLPAEPSVFPVSGTALMRQAENFDPFPFDSAGSRPYISTLPFSAIDLYTSSPNSELWSSDDERKDEKLDLPYIHEYDFPYYPSDKSFSTETTANGSVNNVVNGDLDFIDSNSGSENSTIGKKGEVLDKEEEKMEQAEEMKVVRSSGQGKLFAFNRVILTLRVRYSLLPGHWWRETGRL
ncbi:hypothetical protein GQ43DRAFT_427939 [Delitschia confertaspora ATCC 74209]|uniref:Uncharacterized protein n=1 Tax=Delitschia confertaspora ATCC 74209 TaxID=1513339 RepID=A0A9P4JV30_9PLEO|nr:hypothetical protein GQ43DRAFT_427939 [Delitschia confertaspora ATCC 74209]